MDQATDDLDKMSPSAFCNMAFSYKLGIEIYLNKILGGYGKEMF